MFWRFLLLRYWRCEVDLGDGTTMLVAVDPGLFAGGLVEVKSDELQLGMRVIVP